jgi:hypothetical protein
MKTFNNIAGTTSSEFSIGVGTIGVRQVVLSAVCVGGNTIALDRDTESVQVKGTEFYDLKVLGVDQAGNRFAQQIRGTVTENGSVTKIEDVFEEDFEGGIELTVSGSELQVNCLISNATTATYNIYITLQRIA